MALLMDPNPFALSILNDPRFASLFQHPSQAVLPSLPAQTALASQRTVVLSCKDEDRIVQALYHTRTHSKMTTLETIESITEDLPTRRALKDYYLTHENRINKRVTEREHERLTPTKSTFRADNTRVLYSGSLKRSAMLHTDPPCALPRSRPSREKRSTEKAAASCLTTRRPKIEPVPTEFQPNLSLSPMPPQTVEPMAGGHHRYTPTDRDYFFARIAFDLNRDPTLTKTELCNILAEKAPHHSSSSWQSYWYTQRTSADKILAGAKKRKEEASLEEVDEESDHDWDENRPTNRKRSLSEAYGDSDGDTDVLIESMGQPAGPYTHSDQVLMARWIVETVDRGTLLSRQGWEGFSQRHPQRPSSSWAKYYRRHKPDMDRKANEIKTRRLARIRTGSLSLSTASSRTMEDKSTLMDGSSLKLISDADHCHFTTREQSLPWAVKRKFAHKRRRLLSEGVEERDDPFL